MPSEESLMPTLHQVKDHPTYVDGCFACRIGTIISTPNSSTTSGLDPGGSAKMEAQIELDRPAYKSMRQQGLRPAKVIGSHKLMTEARTSFEIESGKLMPEYTPAQIESGVREAESALGHKIKEVKLNGKVPD
jgi:hypothetical protein